MSFTPVTKKELKLAIEDYIKNNNKEKYKIINEWDVSNIQDMEGLFENYNEFNENINDWDVSNVIRMNNMFMGCKNFNQFINSKNDIDDFEKNNNISFDEIKKYTGYCKKCKTKKYSGSILNDDGSLYLCYKCKTRWNLSKRNGKIIIS
jgi:hypothetical protein